MIWILWGMWCGWTTLQLLRDNHGEATCSFPKLMATSTPSAHAQEQQGWGVKWACTAHRTQNVAFFYPDTIVVCVSQSALKTCIRAASSQCVYLHLSHWLVGCLFHTNERTGMFQQEFFAHILDTKKKKKKRSHLSENLSEHTNNGGFGVTNIFRNVRRAKM